jgi:hypothetical protein
MANVQIPDDYYEKLTAKALAVGYKDLTDYMIALAGMPFEDPRGSVGEELLRNSLSQLELGDSDIDVGKGMDVEKAFRHIADKHGLILRQ